MRTRLFLPISIILITTLCTAVANDRVSRTGSMAGELLPAEKIANAPAANETRTLVAGAGSSAARGWRVPMSSATNYSAPQAVSLMLWSGSLVSAAHTPLGFLSALTSVNATTALTSDSTADITLVLKFTDIAQGAVVANPISDHVPPGACQGATLQHGLQTDITPIPGAIIIPPQPNPPLADPAIISSVWRDCQGEVIEQWHCYVYSGASAPRGKLRFRCRIGCSVGPRG